jgi:RES domain-containing protein
MIVYRLCKQEYVNDLSGRGAEINGGRWNDKGMAALYTANSRALAVLEVAVHVPFGIIPINYFMVAIDIPDGADITEIKLSDLPTNWNRNPIVKRTQEMGDGFLKDNKHLALKVPSATIPAEHNYLINPRHPDFKNVKVLFSEPFEFDSRLFKK